MSVCLSVTYMHATQQKNTNAEVAHYGNEYLDMHITVETINNRSITFK